MTGKRRLCETESNDDLTSFQQPLAQHQPDEVEHLSQQAQSQLSLSQTDEHEDLDVLNKSFWEEDDETEPKPIDESAREPEPVPVPKTDLPVTVRRDLVRERATSILAAYPNIDKSFQRPLSAFTVIGEPNSTLRDKAPVTAKRQKTDQRRCDQENPETCKTCGGTVQW